jgi:hypothetical protein
LQPLGCRIDRFRRYKGVRIGAQWGHYQILNTCKYLISSVQFIVIVGFYRYKVRHESHLRDGLSIACHSVASKTIFRYEKFSSLLLEVVWYLSERHDVMLVRIQPDVLLLQNLFLFYYRFLSALF